MSGIRIFDIFDIRYMLHIYQYIPASISNLSLLEDVAEYKNLIETCRWKGGEEDDTVGVLRNVPPEVPFRSLLHRLSAWLFE